MIPAELTPSQFEMYVKDWLTAAGQELVDFQVTNLETVEGSGGDYEMDAVARLTVFGGAEIVILVECKHHRNPIKREVVMVLESKLRDTKAHKGMIFSTAAFQKGALTFAHVHGIATLRVTDGGAEYMTKSYGSRPPLASPASAVAWFCAPEEGAVTFSLVSREHGETLRRWMLGP